MLAGLFDRDARWPVCYVASGSQRPHYFGRNFMRPRPRLLSLLSVVNLFAKCCASEVYQEPPCEDIAQAYCIAPKNISTCPGNVQKLVYDMRACPVQFKTSKVVCCMPIPYPEEPCTTNGGDCINYKRQKCSGVLKRKIDGQFGCPTQKYNIRCCVTDRHAFWNTIIALVVILLLFCVTATVALLWKLRGRILLKLKLRQTSRTISHNSTDVGTLTTNDRMYTENQYESHNLAYFHYAIPQRFLIDREQLAWCDKDVIGRGNFGQVYGAKWHCCGTEELTVAVKVLKASSDKFAYWHSAHYAFLQEGLRMAELKHDNVIQLLGICFLDADKQLPAIVTQFMPNGDLLRYLQSLTAPLPNSGILTFAVHIANGMAYLHEQSLMHRDLAARNCMLDDKQRVKIADFGLCRQVDASGTYQKCTNNQCFPIEWLPPEAFRRGQDQFSLKTDVWSFGVVVWELASSGAHPYDGVVTPQHIFAFLSVGNRLQKPTHCSDEIYDTIVTPCWHEHPLRRPCFTQISHDLLQLQEQACSYHNVTSGESSQDSSALAPDCQILVLESDACQTEGTKL